MLEQISTKSIINGGVALLLLVNTFISAENCDVNLARSKCGRVTRIDSGNNYAVIQYNPDNTWKAYTLNNGQLTVADSSADTNPSYGKEFDNQLQDSSQDQNLKVSDGELPENSENAVSTIETTGANNAELDKLLSSPLQGAKFSTDSGRLSIDSSNGNKWALKSDNGQHVLYNDPMGNTMAVLNLNATSKYSNILLQNNTLAIFVDQQCQIETVPTLKLSDDQAAEVGNLKRRATQDNNHGRGPNMPPPPPRPFSPFNSFGQYPAPPQGPFQPQQGPFYQPRHYLRIINPFRGMGQ